MNIKNDNISQIHSEHDKMFCSGKQGREQKENKLKFLFHLYSMSIEDFKFLSIYITAVNCTKIKLTSSILVPLSFLLKRVDEKYAACTVRSNHLVSTITKTLQILDFQDMFVFLAMSLPERATNVQGGQTSTATLKKLQLNHKQAYSSSP